MSFAKIEIHPRAIVSPSARLASGVRISAYSIVGDEVELGEGTVVDSHAVIYGPARLGRENHLFSHCVIGSEPQDVKYRGERVALEIGDGNKFREFVTVNRGTQHGGGVTRIGTDNLFMVYSHIAHDCQVGDHAIFVNGATLAGHVLVEDYVTLGAFSPVQQFCRLGRHSYIGGYSVITQDVPPFSKVTEPREARCYGVNTIGLERRGFSPERIRDIEAAYRLLLRSKLNTSQALEQMRQSLAGSEDVAELIRFFETAERGVIK